MHRLKLLGFCHSASQRSGGGFAGLELHSRDCAVMFLTGLPLAPAAITSMSGNPWVAVLYTWGLAQVSCAAAETLYCCVGSCATLSCCVCVSVCGVCRTAQFHRQPGDCLLPACLRCSGPGLSGSGVGVGSQLQVTVTKSLKSVHSTEH